MSVSEGKAERPGVGEEMRVRSSDCRLQVILGLVGLGVVGRGGGRGVPFDHIAVVGGTGGGAGGFSGLLAGGGGGGHGRGAQPVCHGFVGGLSRGCPKLSEGSEGVQVRSVVLLPSRRDSKVVVRLERERR